MTRKLLIHREKVQWRLHGLTFAVDRRGSREGEPNADFFRCTAFDRKAELLERFGRKGLKLLLTGKMQNNNYTNKEGVKVYSMQYLVDDVEFAESKKNSSEDGGNQDAAGKSAKSASAESPTGAEQSAGTEEPAVAIEPGTVKAASQAAGETGSKINSQELPAECTCR